jgi:hypothetical protein
MGVRGESSSLAPACRGTAPAYQALVPLASLGLSSPWSYGASLVSGPTGGLLWSLVLRGFSGPMRLRLQNCFDVASLSLPGHSQGNRFLEGVAVEKTGYQTGVFSARQSVCISKMRGCESDALAEILRAVSPWVCSSAEMEKPPEVGASAPPHLVLQRRHTWCFST